MKTGKKLKLAAPILVALLVTVGLMVLYLWDTNHIRKRELAEFDTDTAGFVWQVESVTAGSVFGDISGYCYPTDRLQDYYNFGFDVYGQGVYLDSSLALVSEDKVLLLPTTPIYRGELLAEPQAEPLAGVRELSFFAGVRARFLQPLIPAGSYRICIVYHDDSGQDVLLPTDREWVKA